MALKPCFVQSFLKENKLSNQLINTQTKQYQQTNQFLQNS